MKGWLPEDKGAAILDVGCGRGEFLRFLQVEGYVNCEGIDLAEEQVEQSKRWNLPVRCEDALDYLKGLTADGGIAAKVADDFQSWWHEKPKVSA